MKEYLNFEEWTFDGISAFIESAVNQDTVSPLYLLGKAAAYVDAGFSFGELSESEARELHTRIACYAGCSARG